MTEYLQNNVIRDLVSGKKSIDEISKMLSELKKTEPLSSGKYITPYVYTNRVNEINNILYYFQDKSQKLLLLGGIQGSGKSSLIRSIMVSCHNNVLVYWYECSKITNLDDLLLSLCAFFDKKTSKNKYPSKNRAVISIDERLISYLKTLDRPLIIVIDSIEHLVSPSLTIEDDELKYFFNYLLEHPLIKLILVGQRLPTGDMDYNEEFITEVRTTGLSEEKSIDLLREHGLESSNTILSEVYKYSRGYPWVLLLAAVAIQRLNLQPDKLLHELSVYDDAFESYLLKVLYRDLSQVETNLLDYLSVFRHPVNIPALSSLERRFEDPVNYLRELFNLKLIQNVGKRYYVNTTVRKNVYNMIPVDKKCDLHNKIANFYSAEISKKLAERTIRLSRKLLHSEQYFHNMTSSQLYADREKFDKKRQVDINYLPSATKDPLAKNLRPPEYRDVDLKYVHSYEQMKMAMTDTTSYETIEPLNASSLPGSSLQDKSLADITSEKPFQQENMPGKDKQPSGSKEVIEVDGLEIELSEEEMELINENPKKPQENNFQYNVQQKSQPEDTIVPAEDSFDLDLGFVTKDTEENRTDTDLIESLRFVAKSYADEEKYNLAIERYNEALGLCEELNNHLEYAKTLIPMSGVYIQLKQHEKALELLEKARSAYEKLNDYTEIPLIMASMAEVYTENYQHEKALMYFNQALKLPPEMIQNQTKARIYMGMGEIYDYRNQLNDALRFYQQALKAFEEINDLINQANLFSRMALIYDDMRDFKKAIQYYTSSITIDKQLGRKQTYAATLANLASVYDEMGDRQKAISHYKQSLIIDKELNNMEGLYKTLSRIGTLYIETGNVEKSLNYYQQELKVARKVKDPYWIAMAYLDMGDLYYFTKDFVRAAKCFLISQKVISKSISTDSREKIERRIRKIQDYIPGEHFERIKKKVYTPKND
jgi:tetratricopeptide (TPR) repeat protein